MDLSVGWLRWPQIRSLLIRWNCSDHLDHSERRLSSHYYRYPDVSEQSVGSAGAGPTAREVHPADYGRLRVARWLLGQAPVKGFGAVLDRSERLNSPSSTSGCLCIPRPITYPCRGSSFQRTACITNKEKRTS